MALPMAAVGGGILAQSPAASQPAPPEDSQAKPERPLRLPPLKGSQLDPEDNNCAQCHGQADMWVSDPPHKDDRPQLLVSPESLAEDVHFLNGVNCHDCHGGDPSSFDVPEAHSTEVDQAAAGVNPFHSPLSEVRKRCGDCHKDQQTNLRRGVHAKAGERDERDRGTPLGCMKCHGEKAHGLLPVKDQRSHVFLDQQVETCGGCHEKHLEEYKRSVHGHGLYKSGLRVTAGCADCHGAHSIEYPVQKRSTLYPDNVATTCGKCHQGIEQRLKKSVHGRGNGAGGAAADRAAPAGEIKRKASGTD